MKPWTTWFTRLGIAGACFLVTGCGGGNVPDASSDGQVSTGSEPGAGGGGAAPAPAAVAAGEDSKVAQADPPQKPDQAPAESAPEPETPAATPKSDQEPGKSTTAEMLALATGPAGGASPPAGGAAPPTDGAAPAAPSAPASPGGANNAGGMMRPGAPGSPSLPGGGMGPSSGPQMGPNAPGQTAGAEQMAKMTAGMTQRPPGGAIPGGDAANPGGAGRPGGAPADNGPTDLHSPEGAVRAFLNALHAKDADRLNESTALRAPSEASAKNHDLFVKISELNLSDSELDELANKLDGYRISFENPPKSTKRVEVVLQKSSNNGGYFQRKITVRLEKKGWGVLDIGPAQEFKSLSGMPKRRRP